MRRLLPLAAIAGLSLATAASASASTVGLDASTGLLVFRSGAPASDVAMSGPFDTGLLFADAAQTLKPGAGCLTVVDGIACGFVRNVDFRLGGGNDRVQARSRYTSELLASGGDGNDDINLSSNAGVTANGGPGDDTIRLDADGGTSGNGGAGADHLRGGGAGTQLHGNDGDDLLAPGWAGYRNLLAGDGGNDQVILDNGRGAADGGAGADTIVTVTGLGLGGWTIDGGAGDDVIDAGQVNRGPHVVSGGGGSDTISIADGLAGTVTCGAGKDQVYADADDAVAADCERVTFGPMPASAAVDAALAHYAETFGAG